MNSDRRHQLENNDLAEKVLAFFDKIQPYITPVLLGILVCFVAYLGLIVYQNNQNQYSATVCDGIYSNLDNAAKLEEIGQSAGAGLGDWAFTLAGNTRLINASRSLPDNKAAAIVELEQAESDYSTVTKVANAEEVLQMAMYGLARTYEQRAAIDPTKADYIKKAAETYTSLAKKWPAGMYAKLSTSRAAALSDETVVKLLADYSKYEKTQPEAGQRNDIPLDINAPAPTDVEVKADVDVAPLDPADAPKVDEPKADEPKAEEVKAEEPKAEESKAEESKAEESKAEEPKAEEVKADEPKAEEPKAEEPKAEEVKADEVKADEAAK